MLGWVDDNIFHMDITWTSRKTGTTKSYIPYPCLCPSSCNMHTVRVYLMNSCEQVSCALLLLLLLLLETWMLAFDEMLL